MLKIIVRIALKDVYSIETTTIYGMNKNDTIVTNIVIHALKMDDTIKKQEVIIERLRSDNNELLALISRMKTMLLQYAPDSIKQLELFRL